MPMNDSFDIRWELDEEDGTLKIAKRSKIQIWIMQGFRNNKIRVTMKMMRKYRHCEHFYVHRESNV